MGVDIREKPDPLAGFVFVIEGAQTLFGRLCEDKQGHPYLEPVYVYRFMEEKARDKSGQVVAIRQSVELHPLFGFDELRRKDLANSVGVSVNDLTQKSRDMLAGLVEQYETNLRAKGFVTLVRP